MVGTFWKQTKKETHHDDIICFSVTFTRTIPPPPARRQITQSDEKIVPRTPFFTILCTYITISHRVGPNNNIKKSFTCRNPFYFDYLVLRPDTMVTRMTRQYFSAPKQERTKAEHRTKWTCVFETDEELPFALSLDYDLEARCWIEIENCDRWVPAID